MNRIAVIGANEPLLHFYRRAKELGYYIVGIAWEEGAVCKKYCDKFYPISFKEKEKVLEVCRQEKINGIISFSLESALPTVIFVAQSMGLCSNSYSCLEKTSTKFSQREAFKKKGIAVPKYFMIKDETEIIRIDIKCPVIVKPVDAGGSLGVTKVDDYSKIVDAYRYAKTYSKSSTVLIEEYIDGREFSVEHISCNGRHYLLQITDKVTSGAPNFIEMQHHQPADISKDLYNRIEKEVSIALDALEIENSVSHTELKLNEDGNLYIIEIGARMGGDFITSDLVYLSTGYDLVKGAIDLAQGKFEVPVRKFNKYSGVYFYSTLAPEILDIIKSKEKYPEIIDSEIYEGDLPEAKSNADRGGYFIYQSKDGRFSI